jgi:hypothetical protein
MSAYLYGIVAAPAKAKSLKFPKTGVGDPPAPVRLIQRRDLAALASDVPDDYHPESDGLRGMRRDMRAHAAVLNNVIESTTVLPFRFGVVLPDDESVIARLLRPRAAQLAKYLDQLEGSVEVTLRATSIEQEAIREALANHPELAPRPRHAVGGGSRRGGGGGGTSLAYESRIDLGRQLAAAIQNLQDRDARLIANAVTPIVRNIRIGKPLRDLMALNASFLVDRARLKKFDRTLEKLRAELGHRLKFDCVGPLAPFSFVDLSL